MFSERILIFEVNWLGDVLFSTPAIRALRKNNPHAFIACLVHIRCKEVLEGNPYIDHIIALDEKDWHRGFLGKLKLISQLRKMHFDTVYLFHRSFTRALICFLSGIKKRIGYYTKKRSLLLFDKVAPLEGQMHRAHYFYYLVTRSTQAIKRGGLLCDFYVSPFHRSFIENTLKCSGVDINRPVICMHPSGNWPLKRWPKEYFAHLADGLIERFGVSVVFSGASKEKILIEDILMRMRNSAIDLSGMVTLKQLGALFLVSSLVVSGDSGPLHIAVALKRPVVALYGPTSIELTGPLAEHDIVVLQDEVGCAIPCYKLDCQDNRCMKRIHPDKVLQKIEDKKWLEKRT